MDTTTTLTIISIIVAIIIGIWQIQLARKQIQTANRNPKTSTKIKKNSKNTHDKLNLEEGKYREKPYPGEIFNITNQLPLIQRHEARNKYAGIKVKWHGKIQNLYLEKSDIVALTISVDNRDGTNTSARCKIRISNYPEIKVAKAGDGIWVFGEIKYVDNVDIELKDCEIKLD